MKNFYFWILFIKIQKKLNIRDNLDEYMDNIYQKINNFLNIVIKNVFHQIFYI